jgi:DNA-binding winged helix-turn-helix (wHTH) protein
MRTSPDLGAPPGHGVTAASGATESALPGDFRVDGWLVEPSRNRLVRGSTAIHVRPQLIDVLTCLAARPGQVVSKARLLSEVWSDRYVAETGVSRCMAELRQVLEDDAKQPRIIETIPKRGYRLIAPVVRAGTHDTIAAAAPAGCVPPPAACPAIQTVRGRRGGAWWHLSLAATARLFLAAAGVLTEVAKHLARRVGS